MLDNIIVGKVLISSINKATSNPVDSLSYIFHLKALHGPLCDFRCTLLQQLHFNSFPYPYVVCIELILCIKEKIVLSYIWCDFISDKMSINKGVNLCAVAATNCSQNRIVVLSRYETHWQSCLLFHAYFTL